MAKTQQSARFDKTATAVVVEHLTIIDRDVVREAQRWTSGRRGPVMEDANELVLADLSAFANEAILIGARALAVTAQTTETRALQQMLQDVGDRTVDASLKAAELTERAVKGASDTVTKVAADAKEAITEADERNRKELSNAVIGAKQDLTAEIRRLFGGESPELLERLQPLLDKFGRSLEAQVRTSTSELLEKAAKQFDPADPTSPMAKHAAAFTTQQEKFTQQIDKNHAELATKVDDLTTALKVQEAKTALATVTPIKGGSFEDKIHKLMHGIAAGVGLEYEDTTTMAGFVPRSKKGDGVLNLDGGTTRIVVEMTDSSRTRWGDYLDEAERNRAACAALALVRQPRQNGNHGIRVLGARRIVMAFDPEKDDPELLRTVVLLLRTVAMVASARTGVAEIATAEEKLAEALTQLDKIEAVKKLAGGIQKSAIKIDSECTGFRAAIHRLLDQAQAALAGAPADITGQMIMDAETGVA